MYTRPQSKLSHYIGNLFRGRDRKVGTSTVSSVEEFNRWYDRVAHPFIRTYGPASK